MITIIPANSIESFDIIETLADTIWRSHYIPIIGKAQVDYMLNKFQTKHAIELQAIDGFEYYILYFHTEPVGYISFKKGTKALFLSKIYVLSSQRGKKIGKSAMNFINQKAKTYNLEKVRLTVNIHNENAIAAYKKLGFKNNGSVVTDIGNGFVMDDFEMIKLI